MSGVTPGRAGGGASRGSRPVQKRARARQRPACRVGLEERRGLVPIEHRQRPLPHAVRERAKTAAVNCQTRMAATPASRMKILKARAEAAAPAR